MDTLFNIKNVRNKHLTTLQWYYLVDISISLSKYLSRRDNVIHTKSKISAGFSGNELSSRDLHGNRSNCRITAVETGVTGSHFYRGSGGNGDSCLETKIDHHGKTAVIAVMGTISVPITR